MERVKSLFLLLLCFSMLFLISCESLSEDGETAVEEDASIEYQPPQEAITEIANLLPPASTDETELLHVVQPDEQILSEEEKNIADALTLVLHGWYTNVVFIEYPIIELFEGADVEVSYVQGYNWRGYGYENKELLELAPDGITCFLRAPEQAMDGSIYAVFNLGRKEDGTYYSHATGFFPLWDSPEEYLRERQRLSYQPINDYLQKFEFHVPYREAKKFRPYSIHHEIDFVYINKSERIAEYIVDGSINYLILTGDDNAEEKNIDRINYMLRYIPYTTAGSGFFPDENLGSFRLEHDCNEWDNSEVFHWRGSTNWEIVMADAEYFSVKYRFWLRDAIRSWYTIGLATFDMATGELISVGSLYDTERIADCIKEGRGVLLNEYHLTDGFDMDSPEIHAEFAMSFLSALTQNGGNLAGVEYYDSSSSANFCLDDSYIYVKVPYEDSLDGYVLLAVPRNEI